ncbi:hypothetical protein FOZ62_025266, partial [Perkinsus olseni]
MSFRSFAVDSEAPDSPRIFLKMYPQSDALPGIERSVNASGQGGVYEPPIGKCKHVGQGDVSGCSCNPPASLAGVTDGDKVFAVVCTEKCSGASSCPKPPKGSVECKPFGSCLINCKNDQGHIRHTRQLGQNLQVFSRWECEGSFKFTLSRFAQCRGENLYLLEPPDASMLSRQLLEGAKKLQGYCVREVVCGRDHAALLQLLSGGSLT